MRASALSVRKLSILTGARPATFDVYRLNDRVRDVSGCVPVAIVSLLSLKSLRMILLLSSALASDCSLSSSDQVLDLLVPANSIHLCTSISGLSPHSL